MNKPRYFKEIDDDVFRETVESGKITERDIQIMDNVMKNVRKYQLVGQIGGAMIPAFYGIVIKRPRWTARKTFLISTLGSISGAGIAAIWEASALIKSINLLEDSKRFNNAIKDMAERTRELRGEKEDRRHSRIVDIIDALPGDKARERDAKREQIRERERRSASGENSSDVNGSWATPVPEPEVTEPSESITSDPDVRSRWSEIRAERKPVQPTSWDTLRQSYEKTKVDTNSPPEDSTSRARRQPVSKPPQNDDDLTEQEKFDALLEKERDMAKGETMDNAARWS